MEMSTQKNRLLLVDGDPKSLRVLDVSLKKAGFDVWTASSGLAALELLEQQTPDLIISDTDLEEMDGFELCAKIKARSEWAKIPFLFVSGRKSIEDKIRGLELGVEDYLTKPIYIREIGIRVRTALQRADREKLESKRDGRTRFAGDLADVSVVDLVQTIELNRKSGIVHIVTPESQRGSIFFRDGKVIDAEVGKLSGANAVYRLFGWAEGQFAVEFKPIRRFDVIDLPVAALLMEGMRRLDESARLLERLPPLRSVVDVDFRVLAEELAELPDEVNGLLRLFDGNRTLQEVIEESEFPDLDALSMLSHLAETKILFARNLPNRTSGIETSDKLAQWLSESSVEDGALVEHSGSATENAEDSLGVLTDGEAVSTPLPYLNPRMTDTMRGFATTADLQAGDPSVTKPGFALALAGVSPKTPRILTQPEENPRRITETFGEALALEVNRVEVVGDTTGMDDTLKGVPMPRIPSAKGDASGLNVSTPQVERLADPGEQSSSPTKEEKRTTGSLGLAERILSEDSSIRATALLGSESDEEAKVASPARTDRTTREYGNTPVETAADIVHDVVASARSGKAPLPPAPAKPSKEVDWGPFSSEPSPADREPMPDKSSAVAVVEDSSARKAVDPPNPEKPAKDPNPGDLREGGAPVVVGAETNPESVPPAPLDESRKTPALLGLSARPVESEIAPSEPRKTPSLDARVQPAPKKTPTPAMVRSAKKTKSGREVVLLLSILAVGLGATFYFVRSSSLQQETVVSSPAVDAASIAVAEIARASSGHQPVVNPPKPSEKPVLNSLKKELRDQCLQVDADGKGKTKEVAKVCRQALIANPEDTELMVLLSRAELDRGKIGEARTLARKAITLKPDFDDAYIYLGGAEQELGRLEEAKAAYKKYLELSPEGRHAKELRAILNNL